MLVDVIAIVCLLVAPIMLLWLLLCHLWEYCIFVADLIARFWLMLLPNLLLCLADVIANMADVIAIYNLFLLGRCYLPEWQME